MMKIEVIEETNQEILDATCGQYRSKTGTCPCGEQYNLLEEDYDFICKCGRMYNQFGQELDSFSGNGDDR